MPADDVGLCFVRREHVAHVYLKHEHAPADTRALVGLPVEVGPV